MTDRGFACLMDGRMSREARIMGAYLAHHQGEEVSMSTSDWQKVLGRSPRGGAPKRQTIAGYVSELEMYEWAEHRPGGSGSPRYRFLPSPSGTGNISFPSPSGLSRPPAVTSPVPQEDGKASPPPLTTTSTTSSSLSREAEKAIEEFGDTLAGCRGALRDYLRERVEPARQLAYVQTLVGMIEGTDEWAWTDGTGKKVPMDERPAIVGGCLNELRTGDEVGRYFPQPPGGIKNLRSKIRFKAKSWLGVERDAKKADAEPDPPATARSQPQRRVHVER